MQSAADSGAENVANVEGVSLRHCLGYFATGVAVVTYEGDAGPRGVTVNSFTSVSLEPPLILICLGKRSKAVAHVLGRPFGVNVLHAEQHELALHFAGRPEPKYVPQWFPKHETPLLSDQLAWLVCQPWHHFEAGDHLVVIGRVSAYGVGAREPLCFFGGRFLTLPHLG